MTESNASLYTVSMNTWMLLFIRPASRRPLETIYSSILWSGDIPAYTFTSASRRPENKPSDKYLNIKTMGQKEMV